MTLSENIKRIHPLVAVAAASVTLFSLLGIAAITGVLPTSHSASVEAPVNSMQDRAQTSRADGANTLDEVPVSKHAPKAAHLNQTARVQQPSVQADGAEPVQRSPATGAATQTAHKPAPQNSPVGIGVGAVIGGVLGNQVGSGDGKTLATILGAVGGGYLGNEVVKKNQ
jgi:uncharacterized protein YcfJ